MSSSRTLYSDSVRGRGTAATLRRSNGDASEQIAVMVSLRTRYWQSTQVWLIRELAEEMMEERKCRESVECEVVRWQAQP